MRAPGRNDRYWDQEPYDDQAEGGDDEATYSPEVNAYWEEFRATTYSGKVSMFTRALGETDLLDNRLALAMLAQLFQASVERGPDERERFDHLVATMRKRRPELYEPNAAAVLSWLIENALGTGRYDAVPPLTAEMADRAGAQPELFSRAVEQMAYHGRLPVIVEAMRRAWPHVQENKSLPREVVEANAQRGADYEVFLRLVENPAADAGDPVLLGRLRVFLGDVPTEPLANRLERLAGRRTDAWKPTEFELHSSKLRPGEKGRQRGGPAREQRQRLFDLGSEFVGWLRRREDIPYPKGELGWAGLLQYFLDSDGGEIGRDSPPPAPLCPEAVRLDRFFASLGSPFEAVPHRVAATFELVPAWLRFLESRQLITEGQRRQTIEGLRPLAAHLTDYLEGYKADPNLFKALESWGEALDAAAPSATT